MNQDHSKSTRSKFYGDFWMQLNDAVTALENCELSDVIDIPGTVAAVGGFGSISDYLAGTGFIGSDSSSSATLQASGDFLVAHGMPTNAAYYSQAHTVADILWGYLVIARNILDHLIVIEDDDSRNNQSLRDAVEELRRQFNRIKRWKEHGGKR